LARSGASEFLDAAEARAVNRTDREAIDGEGATDQGVKPDIVSSAMAKGDIGPEGSEAVTKVRKASDRKNSAVRRVAQAADTGEKRDQSLGTRLGFPMIVGIVALLGMILVIYAWATRDALVRPTQGDHWHAVYGVYDCTLNDETGGYLPLFQSQIDVDGVHSHQDGLIHNHPFFESSAGTRNTLDKFLTNMQVQLTDSDFALGPGNILSEDGTTCNGEEAVLQVHKWSFNFEATRGDAPEVFTEGLADIKFDNDREVYILAYAPLGAEIPIPPAERFEQLEKVSPIIQSQAPVTEADLQFELPSGVGTDTEDDSGG